MGQSPDMARKNGKGQGRVGKFLILTRRCERGGGYLEKACFRFKLWLYRVPGIMGIIKTGCEISQSGKSGLVMFVS